MDITFFENKFIYLGKHNQNEYKKIEDNCGNNPILVLNGDDNKHSVMYLTHAYGVLAPKMETQGILFLRKEDIKQFVQKI